MILLIREDVYHKKNWWGKIKVSEKWKLMPQQKREMARQKFFADTQRGSTYIMTLSPGFHSLRT